MTNANTSFKNKKQYEEKVRYLTDLFKKSFKAPSHLEQPQLDHIVPIDFGFKHKILPDVLARPENLSWIEKQENLEKGNTLTEEGKRILKEWYDNSIIDSLIGEETEYNVSIKTLWKQLKERFKNTNSKLTSMILSSEIAFSFQPVWCQRNETLRWEKTKRALGTKFLETHRLMACAVYPDGKIERLDGNTRSYIFKNNLHFPGYQVPSEWFVTFFEVENEEEAEQIYHSIDSNITAETFNEKLSGYMRAFGYHEAELPVKWKKGEAVYDIAVTVLDGYIPANETETISIENVKSDGERAAKTAEVLDYFMPELVEFGRMIGQQNIRKELTAPLIGMLVRYMMVNKSEKVKDGIYTIIIYANNGYRPWTRPRFDDSLNNLFIMMDELQTPDSMGSTLKFNPHIKDMQVTSRRIISEEATKTTKNIRDREMYCGWIAYCFDKYLKGETMQEDILLDVIGETFDDANVSYAERMRIQKSARSKIMDEYKNFWKKH
jgi:hypothetical protein